MSVVYPPTSRGTFRTSTAASLIDFFLISDRLSAAVEEVRTVEVSGVKGHVPVVVTFKPRVTTLRALHLRNTPPLELERVFGPLPPAPCWDHALAEAERALTAAREGDEGAEDLLESAYASWANTAE